VCVCGGRAGGVCYHDNSKLRAGSVDAGSDHLQMTKFSILQLIKFWRSCAPGKGVCGGAKIFGAQCLRLSERFFIPFASALGHQYPKQHALYTFGKPTHELLQYSLLTKFHTGSHLSHYSHFQYRCRLLVSRPNNASPILKFSRPCDLHCYDNFDLSAQNGM